MMEAWRHDILAALERMDGHLAQLQRALYGVRPVATIDASDACASDDVLTFTVETAAGGP